MKFTEQLKSAVSYDQIASIIAVQLAGMKDVIKFKYPSVRTNFCGKEQIRFHCCLLSDKMFIDHIATNDVKQILGELTCSHVQCVPGVFKEDGKHALYVHLDIDASYVPLVLPLIHNAINVRKKQLGNWVLSDQSEEKARDFINKDEELIRLKQQVSARKKLLKTQAKEIKDNHFKTNKMEISKEEERLFNQAGEQIGMISLF